MFFFVCLDELFERYMSHVYVVKRYRKLRKISISSGSCPPIMIESTPFDSSARDASSHVFFEVVWIHLPFQLLSAKIKSKKLWFVFLIQPIHVFFVPNSAKIMFLFTLLSVSSIFEIIFNFSYSLLILIYPFIQNRVNKSFDIIKIFNKAYKTLRRRYLSFQWAIYMENVYSGSLYRICHIFISIVQ